MKNLSLDEYDQASIISCELVEETIKLLSEFKKLNLSVSTINQIENQICKLEDAEWLSNYYDFKE